MDCRTRHAHTLTCKHALPNYLNTHQVASVGLSEEEAKARGLSYKTGKFSFMANSRARAVNDTEGLVSLRHSVS